MPSTAQRHQWFWQLEASPHGPDWFCYASFAPADAPALAAIVGRRVPAEFVHSHHRAEACAPHRQTHSFDRYTDPRSAAALADERPGAIWIYHCIECCGSDLTLERGYGGYPGGAADQGETDLLVALALDPTLTMTGWQIFAGGDGLLAVTVARGADGPSLLAYLTPAAGDVSPP